jgi:hypothetical protein
VKPPICLKAQNVLIPLDDVKRLDIERLEQQEVDIITFQGDTYTAIGFDAIEAVWVMKPSAMEGRRLKWKKGAWAFHNVVAHPLVQVLAWMGMTRQAVALHDATTPRPRGFKQCHTPSTPTGSTPKD